MRRSFKSLPDADTLTPLPFHPIPSNIRSRNSTGRGKIESNDEETANKKIRGTRFVREEGYIYGDIDESIGSRAHFHHVALYASKSNNNRTVYICMRIDSRFQLNTRVYGATQGVSNLAERVVPLILLIIKETFPRYPRQISFPRKILLFSIQPFRRLLPTTNIPVSIPPLRNLIAAEWRLHA